MPSTAILACATLNATMALPTQRLHLPRTYFVASATADRRRLLQREANATLFLTSLRHYRQQGNYKLHAFVVMPDHIPYSSACNHPTSATEGAIFASEWRHG